LLVTIWELGEAAGPLIIAPLSEVYGRYPAFNFANLFFIFGTVISALSQNTGLLIFARFLTGCAVATNVLNPSVIGDLFPPEQRGTAMSTVMLAPLLGGAVGPAIAGAIAQSLGWREVLWIAALIAGVCELAFLTLFRETYKVRILQRRAAQLRKETDQLFRSVTNDEEENTSRAIWESIQRPARVFIGSFVLQILSLYGGFAFAFFYVLSTTLPDILQDIYHFSPARTGASFMSFSKFCYRDTKRIPLIMVGIGSVFGIILCNMTLDKIYIQLRKANNGLGNPEFRLPLLIAGAFSLPVSVALYGWIAGQHWPAAFLLVSVGMLGFSLVIGLVTLMSYVVDAFGIYSASAMTAVLIARCLTSTFLPLATRPLADKLGYGYAFLVLGAALLAVSPVPLIVMRYGSKWRQSSLYTRNR
jgi:MFS family permease